MSYFKINKIDAIDSTNKALKDLHAKRQAMHGDIIWALHQTKGKGQRDTTWMSQPMKNITFSIYLVHSNLSLSHPFQLNCWVALAIKTALEKMRIPLCKIKWPNDILSGNKKLGGILIENIYRGSEFHASVVGIGINVNQTDFHLLTQASSMKLVTGKTFDLEAVLHQILSQLELAFIRQEAYLKVLESYKQQLFRIGELSQFRFQGKVIKATITSVDQQGRLSIVHSDGSSTVHEMKEIQMIY
jgi:BirA family biotin operon repressor/biotin-[acetyl-CoA-carboxylase] ligase